MKSYRMKFMAILLALLMCVCLVDTHALVADEANGPVYESGDLTYTFTLQGSWNTGYNASIRIDNHSAESIEDWRFEMEYEGSISNIWNAVIESNADGKYIIKNAGWNQDIAAGSYVEFGLSGAEAFDKYPSSYKMLTGIAENSSEDFDAVFEITNDWTQGFTGRITITNNTDAVIEDWVLEFDGENEISTLWDGQIVSHEGTHYIVKSADYNQNIPVGGSVSFNFNVDFRTSDAEFTNFALSSYADLSQITPPPVDDDDDYTGPVEFGDIGEAYIKEPTEDDIVVDEETGIKYVRNQLLVSGFMGADKEIYETLFDEIGATIVGYIELSNDFQIEFSEDMTYEELMDMAAYLDNYSFIIEVTLNRIYSYQVQAAPTNDTLYTDGRTCAVTNKDGSGSLTYTSPADNWNPSSPSGDVWGLAKLHIPEAWSLNPNSKVNVGVYDTGFDTYHEDLRFYAITKNRLDTSDDDYYHGTHVAGIMAASHNNSKGISGVATKATLYGYGQATMANTVQEAGIEEKLALAKFIGNQVRVINVSIGFADATVYAANYGDQYYKDKAREEIQSSARNIETYLKKFIANGYDFVICVAAGNTNGRHFISDSFADFGYREVYEGGLGYDTAYICSDTDATWGSALAAITDEGVKNRIIVVGSMDKQSKLSTFSNRGSRVDVVAPGEGILSTVPKSHNSSGYTLMDGTSMASPYVAGIVALMYQANPEIQADHVKDILKRSKTSNASGPYSYPIPNAYNCVTTAFGYKDYVDDISWPSGTIYGNVQSSDDQYLENVHFTAYRRDSGDYNVGTYYAGKYSFYFTSDGEGSFATILPQGTYDITVYKDGYLPFTIKNITVQPDQSKGLGTIHLQNWNSQAFSGTSNSVQGEIRDAISGRPVGSVVVKLRKGWGVRAGSYVVDSRRNVITAATNAMGEFAFYVPAGAYTAEISKDGYVTGYYNVISLDNNTAANKKTEMVISPVLSDDEYRVVLTWGASPSDLDSHLIYYVDDVKTCHLNFNTTSISYEGETLAVLDRDDTSSYGPETVTITFKADLVHDNTKFSYFVHDYSNQNSTNSTAMSMSDATIHLYMGNTLYDTYHIQINKVATEWHVFDITDKGVVVVDKYDNESNYREVG